MQNLGFGILSMKKHIKLLCASFFVFIPLCFATSSQISSVAHPYDTIVVGAGVAGLASAHELQESHHQVLVLEARNRIGGRIVSKHPWGPGLDLGASWIHGVDANPLSSLTHDLKINTVATVYRDNDPAAKLNSISLFTGNFAVILYYIINHSLLSF